jgi:signal transduction histidine kinase
MRWLPRSLHARMLVLSLIATLVALGLAGWAIAGVLERLVVAGLDQRLDAEVALLAATVDRDGRVDRDLLRQRLGAFDDGAGRRWRIEGPDGVIASADFPRLDAAPPRPNPPAPPGPPGDAERLRPVEGEVEYGGRVHARQLVMTTARGPVTLTAAAPWSVVQRPIRGALAPLLAALAVLAVLLTAATLIQLRVGLRPLRALRAQVAAIRTGARTRVDEDQPDELRGLATELNALAEQNAATLATARGSMANLAHALKTPVAALAIELRRDAAQAALVGRIDATIRHHLARARATAIDRRATTPVADAIGDLVALFRVQASERGLRIEAEPGELSVAVDRADLDELLGNLLDNAVRHARSRVVVAVTRDPADPRRVRLDVGDDGPGIAPADRARATAAGVRLDERGGGHGFGLSIVTELASLYGGRLELRESPGGGLTARLILPAAASA